MGHFIQAIVFAKFVSIELKALYIFLMWLNKIWIVASPSSIVLSMPLFFAKMCEACTRKCIIR